MVARFAGEAPRRQSTRPDRRGERGPIEPIADGVARLRVSELESEQVARCDRALPLRPKPMRAGVTARSFDHRRSISAWRFAGVHRAPGSWVRRGRNCGGKAPEADPSASARPMRASQSANSGAGARPEQPPHRKHVVKGCALIVEHHVVGLRNAHHEIHAGHREHRQQSVHVVLIGVGVVGVADVAAHRQAGAACRKNGPRTARRAGSACRRRDIPVR